eukprot:COSAG06_NODE_12035_length_1432_cov_1.453113_1_plen_174_part_10
MTRYITADALTLPTEAEMEEHEVDVARWSALRERFKKGVHAKTAEGAVGVVQEDAAAEGSWVQLILADGSYTNYARKVDTLSEPSEAETAEYKKEAGRWSALREKFKKGVCTKTAEGAVGAVKEDAAVEGSNASKVHLILADGSYANYAHKVDTLSEPSEAETAEYEAEAGRWS